MARLIFPIHRNPTARQVTQVADSRVHTDFFHLKSLQGKARKLSFLPRQRSNSILAGQHASRVRGRGLMFEELRNYRVGDDIRSIDWRVTARTGKPYVRVYSEEKDRSALLIVDQRVNMFFGSRLNMKSVTASETAALCAYSIFARGDRIGAVLFDDQQILSFRPSKKPRVLEQIIHDLSRLNLNLNSDIQLPQPAMHFNRPLQAATKLVTHDQLIIIISDFAEVDDSTEAYLGQLAAHNDLILCMVTDPMSSQLPQDLQLDVSDGKRQMSLDTRQAATRDKLNQIFLRREAIVNNWQHKFHAILMPLSCAKDTYGQILTALAVQER